MPTVSQTHEFDGAQGKIERLGPTALWGELKEILTGFDLRVHETRDSNSAAVLRGLLDQRFLSRGGWVNKVSGDVDWSKCHAVNGTRVCLGVEVQVSARSDLLIVDVVHLRDALTAGEIDVGIIVTSDDQLSYYLTDRVARYTDAVQAVVRARAQDLPLVVLGLLHDGPGSPLPKKKTR